MPINTRTPDTHQPTQPEDHARNYPAAEAEEPGSRNPTSGKQPASAQRARTRKAKSKL